jgi:hypothetical protein
MRRSLMVFLSILLVSAITLGCAMALDDAPLPLGDDEYTTPQIVEAIILMPIIHPNPEHMEAFEELVNASRDLIARGVPIVGFDQHWVTPDPNTNIANIVITVGLREVKDEYKELIKAIVEGVEGIEFDFFQARFTQEEIIRLVDKIAGTFWKDWRRGGELVSPAPGGIDVPLANISSSWRNQLIRIWIYGETKPEYYEAIRQIVGEEILLEFGYVAGGRPYDGRNEGGNYWWQDLPSDYLTPYEQILFKEIVVLIMDRYFGIDVSRMTVEEMDEVGRLIGPEGQERFYRLLREYAQRKGLEIPEMSK